MLSMCAQDVRNGCKRMAALNECDMTHSYVLFMCAKEWVHWMSVIWLIHMCCLCVQKNGCIEWGIRLIYMCFSYICVVLLCAKEWLYWMSKWFTWTSQDCVQTLYRHTATHCNTLQHTALSRLCTDFVQTLSLYLTLRLSARIVHSPSTQIEC